MTTSEPAQIRVSATKIADRLRACRPRFDLDHDHLLLSYWQAHPRFRFLKTAPYRARFLDIGAGSGALAHWKGWGPPPRPDLRMYGLDRMTGEFAPLYEAWETLDLDTALPGFAGTVFDAFYASHVIEHIKDPPRLIGWAASKARQGTRLYLEWPNVTTLDLPPRRDLLAAGIDVMISNFHDDGTHIHLPRLQEIAAVAEAAGFRIVESGVIDVGALADEMVAMGLRQGNAGLLLFGYWSLVHWSTYLIAEFGDGLPDARLTPPRLFPR